MEVGVRVRGMDWESVAVVHGEFVGTIFGLVGTAINDVLGMLLCILDGA